MKVPYSWVKEFVDIDIPASEVAEKLNLIGIETTVYKFGNYIPNITTVKILSVEKHPEKDKLFVCKVSDGEREYQVITGADNVKAGSVVILAQPGAVILGKEIKPVKFGSISSEGMLLSLQELGLEEKSDGIFLLDEDTPIGVDANKVLDIGSDDIFEIEITPNRGDVLSVKGLSREIAAAFGLKRKDYYPQLPSVENSIEINIQTDKVLRYKATVIKGIKVKQSPLSVRLKLIKSGLSVINNIVDITNYILLQEGQPLHAFDLDKIEGKITVRNAFEGEKILTLDGQERVLTNQDIVIADDKKPLAIAGVIGGENSKIDQNTQNILLESAVFDPTSVRKTAKRLSILTDSSYRFERGVDIENCSTASDKAVSLILSLAGGEVKTVKDLYLKPYQPKTVVLRPSFIEKILGSKIEDETTIKILTGLEIPVEKEGEEFKVHIPSFRSYDLEREIDLVEEVARVYGYDKFEEDYPKIPTKIFSKPKDYEFDTKVRQFFLNSGFTEVLNYTFTSPDFYNTLSLPLPKIHIQNYILKSQSVMRDTVVVSLIQNQVENLRFGRKDLSIFELSSTFFDDHESINVAGLVSGKLVDGYNYTSPIRSFSTNRDWDFLSLKGVIDNFLTFLGLDYLVSDENLPVFLHPYESANIIVMGYTVGYVGKIHPKVAAEFEIPKNTFVFELKLKYVPRDINENPLKEGYIYTYYLNKRPIIYKEIPKYPPVKRDLAFVIDVNLKVGNLIEDLKKASNLVKNIKLFDVYFLSNSRKSVAVSVEFLHPDKNLSDEEVNLEVEEILNKLKLIYPDIELRK
ncbi:phenylalanyl-tRNA synthetase, beta subunit [Sulfurihydrogenibium azorense Az-Fu1]|uniref:Phenylalanine--tRNA ligase beta subunit n=1 Tax=Sulfurihydrogenibium azorense (strain DSM 15241 / OCM 825 / Az-Fu1) TaxID=204536 RepID=C1DTM2_SULAA|nr:phenylalanine--tRNA ligase subunit beta [Sulfurihydrogenibium azorense]ACN99656.1 phenylalanyl-tRNA synthetase, beta subunit [Sulfurihydrogenibium azorense Az-Fu1]